MNSDRAIFSKLALVSKIIAYSAFTLILIASVMRFFSAKYAYLMASVGISLVLAAPAAGILLIFVWSVRSGNYKYVLGSVLFLTIFAVVFAVGL